MIVCLEGMVIFWNFFFTISKNSSQNSGAPLLATLPKTKGWIPKMMGLGKGNSLQNVAIFGINSLDFWVVILILFSQRWNKQKKQLESSKVRVL